MLSMSSSKLLSGEEFDQAFEIDTSRLKKTKNLCICGWLAAFLFLLIAIFILVFLLLFLRVPPERITKVIVSTSLGPIVGWQSTRSREFLGVPYAKPPVGPLRWKPPESPAAWSSPRNAFEFGPICAQSIVSNVGSVSSEDCLYLNVFTPTEDRLRFRSPDGIPAHANLPVLVFIHGGGGVMGAANQSRPVMLNGTNFVNARYNLIVVTLNYRLGPFGFMATSTLMGEDAQHAAGHYAAMDILKALQWVKANIAEFGGNPDAITVAGHSAGAVFALDTLVREPRAEYASIVKRVISFSSATAYPVTHAPIAEVLPFWDRVAAAMGCEGADVVCMRGKDQAAVLDAFGKNYNSMIVITPVDGYYLKKKPMDLFRSGDYNNKAPIMMSFTRTELLAFQMGLDVLKRPIPRAQVTLDFLKALNDTAAALGAYPPAALRKPGADLSQLYSFNTPYLPASQPWLCDAYADAGNVTLADDCRILVSQFFGSDWMGRCLARHAALALTTPAPSTRAPLYMLEFGESLNCPAVENTLLPGLASAPGHGDELPYLFHTVSAPAADDPALATSCTRTQQQVGAGALLRDLVTCFMKTGRPDSCGDPAISWPEFTPEAETHLALSRASRIAHGEMLLSCDFWEKIVQYA